MVDRKIRERCEKDDEPKTVVSPDIYEQSRHILCVFGGTGVVYEDGLTLER